MRSRLELRSPSHGTGTGESWALSGRDDRQLRDCLDQLHDHATEPPLEISDRHTGAYRVHGADRWHAAMLLWQDDLDKLKAPDFMPRRADAAWTADGARTLAALLPQQLGDLAAAITTR